MGECCQLFASGAEETEDDTFAMERGEGANADFDVERCIADASFLRQRCFVSE